MSYISSTRRLGLSDQSLEQRVGAVRRFNRIYTRRIGVLQENFLNSSYSLAEGRVLYELAHRQQPTATEVAADLGLDQGYLSRILRAFCERGLVFKSRSQPARRQSQLSLNALGRIAYCSNTTGSHCA